MLPGHLYRINEQGLEGFAQGDYFSPLTAGRVLPATETRRLMSGRGAASGSSLQVDDIHIHAGPGSDPVEIARQVRQQLSDLMAEARFALHDGGLHA